RVSSCSDHIFCAVWNMSGEVVCVVKVLLQKSDHMPRNCRHSWAGSGGCGTAAACDQKVLLFSIKSFQESNHALGGVWFAIPYSPCMYVPLSTHPAILAGPLRGAALRGNVARAMRRVWAT